MLSAWAQGDDLDAAGRPLGEAANWQAELWRRLRARIGAARPGRAARSAPARAAGRADRSLEAARAVLAVRPHAAARRAPAGVARAGRVPRGAPVPAAPSAVLWDRVADRSSPRDRVVPSAAPTTRPPAGPPTGCWPPGGATPASCSCCSAADLDPVNDSHHGLLRAEPTLLGRIQDDIRADREPPGAPLPGRRPTSARC